MNKTTKTTKTTKKEKTHEVVFRMTSVIRTGDFSNVGVDITIKGDDLNKLESIATEKIDTLIKKYKNYNERLGIMEDMPISEVDISPNIKSTEKGFTQTNTPVEKSPAYIVAREKLDESPDQATQDYIVTKIQASTKLTEAEKLELLSNLKTF